MENSEEFEAALFRLILDGKRKLAMTDETIAYLLLKEGTNYLLKTIIRRECGVRDIAEYNQGK